MKLKTRPETSAVKGDPAASGGLSELVESLRFGPQNIRAIDDSRFLEGKLEGQSGRQRTETQLRLSNINREQLGDLGEGLRHFAEALRHEPEFVSGGADLERYLADEDLRPQVIELWGPACAACGLELSSIDGDYEVEVAHIQPVSEDGLDLTSNTLPLCRTHHWAFDRHLFSVDPATFCLQVTPPRKKNPALATLHGRSLRQIPKGIDRAAITEALRAHFRQFCRAHRRGTAASAHPGH